MFKNNQAKPSGEAAFCREFALPVRTAISPDGAAVAMKPFQAAIVAAGAKYEDWVAPDP